MCYFRDKNNNNTSGVCHSRRGIPKCSALEYPIYVVDDSDSTTKQRRYSIVDEVLLGALQWKIGIVLLLTLKKEQHKFNLPLQRYFKGQAIRYQVDAVIEYTQQQYKSIFPLNVV